MTLRLYTQNSFKFLVILIQILAISNIGTLQAQDVVYLLDSSKVESKVIEVAPSTIKIVESTSGNEKIIKKKDVVLTVFENGIHEQFPKTEKRNIDFKRRILSLNYGELNVGRINVNYEKLNESGKLGIKVPLGVRILQRYNLSPFLVYSGVGLNFYPLGQKKVSYLVGTNLRFGLGQYILYSQGQEYQKTDVFFSFGPFISNGITVHFTEKFSMSTVIGLGIMYGDHLPGFKGSPKSLGELSASLRW